MSSQSDSDDETEPNTKVLGGVIMLTLAVIFAGGVFVQLQDTPNNDVENRFDIEYHDNGTASIQFRMENERIYTEDVFINGQSATRFYTDSPELLSTNQTARVDVTNHDQVVITNRGYTIYVESVPGNISNP